MKNFLRVSLLTQLSILGLLISACTQSNPTSVPAAHTSTALQVPTGTATVSPTIPVPSRTPTVTPLPTLPAEDALALLFELFENNGGCQLPCWWGITPGETTWESAHGFLAPFSSEIVMLKNKYNQIVYEEYFPVFDVPEWVNSAGDIRYSFMVDDEGTVIFIRTINPWWIDNSDFSLSGLLSTYGAPTEIRLIVQDTYSVERLITHYYVTYTDLGVMFAFEAVDDRVSNTGYLCPHKIAAEQKSPYLWLWDPALGWSFNYLHENNFIWALVDDYLNIEDVSELDVNSFYEAYKDANSRDCFETSSEHWPWGDG